jgi:hypothetical protein
MRFAGLGQKGQPRCLRRGRPDPKLDRGFNLIFLYYCSQKEKKKKKKKKKKEEKEEEKRERPAGLLSLHPRYFPHPSFPPHSSSTDQSTLYHNHCNRHFRNQLNFRVPQEH